MHIRVIYDDLGIEKGYTTFLNTREKLIERLNERNISISSIKVLKIDGKGYNPKLLMAGDCIEQGYDE